MLSDIYNWFTEGFDTKDLQEAKRLLQELGSQEAQRQGRQKSVRRNPSAKTTESGSRTKRARKTKEVPYDQAQ
jgi:hypothetical protein